MSVARNATYNGAGARCALRPCDNAPEQPERRGGAFSLGYGVLAARHGQANGERRTHTPNKKFFPHPHHISSRVPYRYLAPRGMLISDTQF